MSQLSGDKDDNDAVEYEAWREQAEELADYCSSFCCTCNACVPRCPAAKHGTGFSPQEIVLKARYGLGDTLFFKGSVLCQCFRCYRCLNLCPQEVKPAQVIALLKETLSPRVLAS